MSTKICKTYLSKGTWCGPVWAILCKKRKNFSNVSKKGQCDKMHIDLIVLTV